MRVDKLIKNLIKIHTRMIGGTRGDYDTSYVREGIACVYSFLLPRNLHACVELFRFPILDKTVGIST